MTPEQQAIFDRQAREILGKPEVTGAAPVESPPPSPAPHAPATLALAAAMPASRQAAVSQILARPGTKEGIAAVRQQETTAPQLMLGDVLELDPEEAEQRGLTHAAALIREIKRLGGPNDYSASAFSSEWGQQKASALKQIPLQRMTGSMGVAPADMEQRLRELHFMLDARKAGHKSAAMAPDEYGRIEEQAGEEARRDVARVLGASEERGNVIIDPHPEDAVKAIQRGEDIPWLLRLTPFGAYPTAAAAWEKVGGARVEDQTMMKIMAPIYALARPGTQSIDVQTGAPVIGGAKESKLWWLLRLGYSTPLYSWSFDPTLTWELGGENGWGGKRHIQKIVSGDDGGTEILNYVMPATKALADDPSPKNLATAMWRINVATAAGMGMILEPDVLSTGLAAAGTIKQGFKNMPHRLIDEVFIPRLETWKRELMDGRDWTTLGDGLHMLSPTRLLFEGIKNDLMARAAAEAYDDTHGIGAIADLNPENMKNAAQVEWQAQNQKLIANNEAIVKSRKASDAFDAVEQHRANIAVAHDEAADAHEMATRKATKELNAALDEYHSTEAGLVTGTVLRGTPNIQVGGKAFSTRTGEGVEVLEDLGANKYRVINEGGEESVVPKRLLRGFAEPKDSKKVFDELARMKRQRSQIQAARKVAVEAGDVQKVAKYDAMLSALDSKTIYNISDAAYNAAHAAYLAARERVEKASDEAFRLWGTRAPNTGSSAGFPKKFAALKAAMERFDGAMSKVAARERQLKAVQDLPRLMMEVIEEHIDAGRRLSEAFRKGTPETQALTGYVVNSVAKPQGNDFLVDAAKWRKAMTDKYGASAFAEALEHPEMAPFRSMNGTVKMGVETLGKLRDLEKGAHNAAERARLLPMGQGREFLRTLADTKGVTGWSRESWLAWGHQMATRLSRGADFISASTIGKAAKPIRESVRRAVERYYQSEKELGHVATTVGVKGIEEYVTTAINIDGAILNQDTISIAEKCLSYLRTISKGDWWDEDVVVKAMGSAPLASGQVAPGTANIVEKSLKDLVEDGTTTGPELWRWLEKTAPSHYFRLTGRKDTPEVITRFIARAMLQGANQHDTLFDIMRIAGTRIDARSADALNWFVKAEKLEGLNGKKLGEYTVANAREAMEAYGLPRASVIAGKLERLFKATDVSNQLIKLGDIEGKGHWMPRMVLDAMNEVPRNLSKEMREFSDQSRYGQLFDRWSRMWRIATVNGWVVPRAAHWVNTFAGDWAQMVTSLGVREASVISLNSLPAYVPFVGPKLQSALNRSSLLPAMFDPNLAKVMEGRSDVIIHTGDGAVSARKFLQEAYEDGCWDSINTKDLVEATSRSLRKSWDWVAPPHIERSAKMLEEAQHRTRVLLYLRARNAGMTREGAKAKLMEALYDWKTGVPEWEHRLIGRLMTFWTYRRGMARQLGASLTEGFADPSVQYWKKALTGRTNLGRMRNLGRFVETLPDRINWQDPDEFLDDEEQRDAMGMRMAPWWRTAQTVFGNRSVNPARSLWYSEVAGKEVTYETLMLPALTTLDQLHMLNVVLQTAGATSVMAAEKLGLNPSMTTIQADELAERTITSFTDQLYPYAEQAVAGAALQMAGVGYKRGGEYSQGVPLSEPQAVILRRLGFEDFMGVSPDPDGRIRIDAGAYGMFTALLLAVPPVSDFARNWVIFADNPGYQEDFVTGATEAMQRWTGLFAPKGHDPFASRDFEAQAKERALKSMASGLEKQTTPKDMRYR